MANSKAVVTARILVSVFGIGTLAIVKGDYASSLQVVATGSERGGAQMVEMASGSQHGDHLGHLHAAHHGRSPGPAFQTESVRTDQTSNRCASGTPVETDSPDLAPKERQTMYVQRTESRRPTGRERRR